VTDAPVAGSVFEGTDKKIEEVGLVNTWKAIFAQSPVNNGYYKEDELTQLNWDWPRGTWLQGRLEYVREHEPAAPIKSLRKLGRQRNARTN
jgi:hypothetical protein